MKHQLRLWSRALGALTTTVVVAASAGAQVSWTDWTAMGTNTVTGTMLFNSTPIGVTYTGPYYFAQLGCGTDYWNPNVYTGAGVPNAPPNCEIIALSQGGPKTITFSQAVTNPLLAIVSWNGQNPITLNGPLSLIASGCGYWGCGTINVAGNQLITNGEAHGTVQLLGSYTSITFTDGDETWHGITVGAQSISVSAVPEPATMALTAMGLLGLVGVARRRRTR